MNNFFSCITSSPLTDNNGIPGNLALIYELVILSNESVLLFKGTYAGDTHQGLIKVGVDWRTPDGIDTFHLTNACHVDTLQCSKIQKHELEPGNMK